MFWGQTDKELLVTVVWTIQNNTRYSTTENMFEDKILKKCIRNVQWISTSKMRQGRECMIYLSLIHI